MRYCIIGLIVAMTACTIATASAITPEEVEAAVNAAAASPRKADLNRAAGDALKKAGRYAEALPYYLKGGNAGNLGAAEASFYLYDFDKAAEYLDKYLSRRTKTEAAADANFSYGNGGEPMDWTDYLASKIDLGRSMLDRVEKIQIIDSINVPAGEFTDFIRLARSAGSITSGETVERIVDDNLMESLGLADLSSPAYVTENGNDVIWYGADSEGNSHMYESSRLADGSWDRPAHLFDYASIFGSTNGSWVSYPFLMSDGVTLYFASDGEESLGDLDIFISRRDGEKFLQPSNIGMPYNSPFNDYLYAIDEETGTGWWVSDRNHIPDSVTIYTFIPQDLRINYEVDTPGLVEYAKVSSIRMTQPAGSDYAQLRRRIAAVDEQRRSERVPEFEFALPDGRVLHRMSDLTSHMARNAMKAYLEARMDVAAMEKALDRMRVDYAGGDRSLSSAILRDETVLERKKASLRELSNQVVSLEM